MPDAPGLQAADPLGLFWPRARLKEAYENLLVRSDLPLRPGSLAGEPPADEILRMIQWVRRAPRSLGVEVNEEEDLPIDRLRDRFLEIDGAILTLFVLRGSILILTAVLEKGRWARVFKPDGTEQAIDRYALYQAIARAVATEGASLAPVFEGLPGGAETFEALQGRDVFGDRRHSLLVTFELDGAHTFRNQLSAVGAWRSLAQHVLISALQAFVAFAAIWTLGSSMVTGQLDAGRVLGWTLLAASDAPLQYLANRSLCHFTISFVSAVKRRLLEGAFFVEEREIRAKGFGELIARTSESSIVEQLSLADASGVVLAIFEILGSAVFLAQGEPRYVSLVALALCLVISAAVARVSIRSYRDVFQSRMKLTDDIVDKIIGHRTRAVQQQPKHRHQEEDFMLADYFRVARTLDTSRAASAILPRLWLVFGAGILLAAFVARAPFPRLVYSGLGILLCYRALTALFPAIQRIVEWYTAWEGVSELVAAGLQRERASKPLDMDAEKNELSTTLSMSSVSFAYRAGGRPILTDLNLSILRGEKVLLEGASGSGKSTILKLVAGEQQSTGGVILVGGTDRFSVSDVEWRRRVASAPQFHENYIFSNTFAFNLDPWGEPGAESAEAREICEELGLRPLLERMPQGFAQVVGETGWQLSHGERSRIFIARALLQRADLFLFDESFGALDPETLLAALECVRKRAKTLLVVAHT